MEGQTVSRQLSALAHSFTSNLEGKYENMMLFIFSLFIIFVNKSHKKTKSQEVLTFLLKAALT